MLDVGGAVRFDLFVHCNRYAQKSHSPRSLVTLDTRCNAYHARSLTSPMLLSHSNGGARYSSSTTSPSLPHHV